MVLAKLDVYMQNDICPLPPVVYKFNSKWVEDINLRSETMDPLKPNSLNN